MLPQADVDPAALRATRARLRRRMPRRRKRAALRTHLHTTTSPDNLPELGKPIASTAHRAGVAERVADPAGHKRIAVDLAVIRHDDSRLRDMAWSVLTTANADHTHPRSLLRTVPGSGEILRLVRLDAIQAIHRFPRGPDLVSDGRLGKWAEASAGKRSGTGGTKSGHASRQGAFSAAAGLLLGDHPSGPHSRTRLETTHGKGQALTVVAQHVARAVYDLRQRATAFQMDTFIHGYRRGAGAPDA